MLHPPHTQVTCSCHGVATHVCHSPLLSLMTAKLPGALGTNAAVRRAAGCFARLVTCGRELQNLPTSTVLVLKLLAVQHRLVMQLTRSRDAPPSPTPYSDTAPLLHSSSRYALDKGSN